MNNSTSKIVTVVAALSFILFFLLFPFISNKEFGVELTGQDILKYMEEINQYHWPWFFLAAPLIVLVFRLLLNVTDSQTKRFNIAVSFLMLVPFISLFTWDEWRAKYAGLAFFWCMLHGSRLFAPVAEMEH